MILGTAAVGTAGAGVTAAAGGLSGSAEGQAEQALTVTDVNVSDNTDHGVSFTRVSDDDTELQAAVELNNGNDVVFEAGVENSAADDLDVEVAVDSPDPIDADVRNPDTVNPNSTGLTDTDDLNPDDDGATSEAVQTGEGTFVAKISGNGSGTGGSGASEFIDIAAELDDTASPGSCDIAVSINPLSTDD
ncbi:MAG: hypothetical protein J07HQX50_00219 [Haloquadratum sp. J07HQX50]|jgi:hypothetical protein|nr:MAG: hypothetical protein J07HQX50_00219 [Haloquadratum sp. J07HQX50]